MRFIAAAAWRRSPKVGRLIEKRVQGAERRVPRSYAWRSGANASEGRALQWWLKQLAHATTRKALLDRPHPA